VNKTRKNAIIIGINIDLNLDENVKKNRKNEDRPTHTNLAIEIKHVKNTTIAGS
jgi:hypothetical protein